MNEAGSGLPGVDTRAVLSTPVPEHRLRPPDISGARGASDPEATSRRCRPKTGVAGLRVCTPEAPDLPRPPGRSTQCPERWRGGGGGRASAPRGRRDPPLTLQRPEPHLRSGVPVPGELAGLRGRFPAVLPHQCRHGLHPPGPRAEDPEALAPPPCAPRQPSAQAQRGGGGRGGKVRRRSMEAGVGWLGRPSAQAPWAGLV